MLFNSPEFLLFLPIIFGLYWFVTQRNLKAQNLLLLLASYVFYGWWDWRFLGLIALSTVVDFLVGIRIEEAPDKARKKRWLWVSLAVNLGILGYFKYANFFIENWISAWQSLGVTMHASTLQVILPVGISFYTFQTLSYSIDIYRGNLKATRDPVAFGAFVSFFPQLVAGPIERATNLLPQITSRREFTYEQGRDGMRLILWGMFKKVVVADSCAPYVDMCFDGPAQQHPITLFLGLVFFAFQIYGDFSGYSDIAIGTAKLFGIELMSNFKTPFFAKSVPEFWNRWHISLNTWMNDYVFFPMAFAWRKFKKTGVMAAVLLTFLISGLWHGSDWKFVLWGAIHGVAFVPYILAQKRPGTLFSSHKHARKEFELPNLKELRLMALPIGVNLIAWIFFRADSITHGWDYISAMTRWNSIHQVIFDHCALAAGFVVLIIDWVHQNDERNPLSRFPYWVRWTLYPLIFWFVLRNLANPSSFIYFQF
ncbi:MBOAT family protein [Flavobacteriales bacterium]|nr:MBOAT family protein [Flavobacteriales bacterium]